MTTLEIIDPRAASAHANLDSGPPLADDLDGAVLGIFVDDLWPSYDLVADEWTALLESRGAKVVRWRASEAARQDVNGDNVPADFIPLADALAGVDFAIVGLGNCGSCTFRTINDTAEVLEAGVGAAAIVTAEFAGFAKVLAKRRNWEAMRVYVLPYPLVTLPKDEITAIARDQLDSLLAACRPGR